MGGGDPETGLVFQTSGQIGLRQFLNIWEKISLHNNILPPDSADSCWSLTNSQHHTKHGYRGTRGLKQQSFSSTLLNQVFTRGTLPSEAKCICPACWICFFILNYFKMVALGLKASSLCR